MKRLTLLFLASALLAGCLTSRVITVTITNHSQETLNNFEVTYPGGSYGISSLASGAKHQYRIKPFFEGELQMRWQDSSGVEHKLAGPKLHKDDEGSLEIAVSGKEASAAAAITGH